MEPEVTLDARYSQTEGRIFLTGIQALVRLPLVQRALDRAAGRETAGFISGYRGSPLAGLDRQLWAAREHLDRQQIHFAPGINEELAMTAVWGSQQVNAFRGARVDGVFGLWYGKAPGVDRSGDALKHGNAAGSSRHGGVLVICGDDHSCKSSTLPSQSEFALMDAGIPILNPAGVQDVLDYGLHGWALSRYSGLWAGVIALADTMDSSASVYADLDRVVPVLPELELPPGGLNFRLGMAPLQQEEWLHHYRRPAALAYARANQLNRTVIDSRHARLGIVTTGKAHLDVLEALAALGIRDEDAERLGIRVFKVGMPWPLEPEGLLEFAQGLEHIVVVEEKRSFVETQLKELLFDAGRAGIVVEGKRDVHGATLLPEIGDLRPSLVARVLAARLPESARPLFAERLAQLQAREQALSAVGEDQARVPYYCAGCPHNRSTVVPEGSRGLAGIGCHYMVQWMDRSTDTMSQMGGEGVSWIGQAPFTDEEHVFANLGDGTYFHSGILAIRAAVAAGVNITYKILYNDAVAMTGGQSVDGSLSVDGLTRQLAAEGVACIAVVSDDPTGYERLASGTTVHHRDELDAVQRRLRDTSGTTVLVYDQTCAAELRRRRKRGLAPIPDQRLFIHQDVCEGCGDCSVQSNCAAVEPVETALGRKRRINQSSCNLDFSCADGLCPAFVSVRGAELRRETGAFDEARLADLPPPTPATLDEPWSLLVTGIGGTGVVTIGALLGQAAHLDGCAATLLDMTGLAQKGGAVTSHVRLGRTPEDLHTPRIPMGHADALLACDLIVATSTKELAKLDPERTCSVVNTHLAPTAEFILNNDVRYDAQALAKRVADSSQQIFPFDATELATRLCGDAIFANTLLLGYAFQQALVPLSLDALERAISLNGVSVEQNLRAFSLGRLAAHDPEALRLREPKPRAERTLDELIDHRAALLAEYQNEAYAERYRARIAAVRCAERQAAFGREDLTRAAAISYAKLLAYKDEYEVARLYTEPAFLERLQREFAGRFKLQLLLAPPLWARRDRHTGRPRKRHYGRWMLTAMRMLAHLKFLRGTAFDIFGYTADRRLERDLIRDYDQTLDTLLAELGPENHALAVKIASLPQEIRGFDLVKQQNAERVRAQQNVLLEQFAKGEPHPVFDIPLLVAEDEL